MQRKAILGGVVLTLPFTAPAALAQNTASSLDDIVVTGSRISRTSRAGACRGTTGRT